MIELEKIKEICRQFNINANIISDIMDTSHGEDDLRYNYIIDNKYVLKINNNTHLKEQQLINISALVDRYRSIDVWAPRLFKNPR